MSRPATRRARPATRPVRCLIDLQDHGGGMDLVEPDRIQIAVDAALARDRLRGRALGVALVAPAASAALHRRHFQVGGRTDVMSFPDGTDDPETGRVRLGDLAVCPAVAVAAARRLGRRAEDEVTLYILHGVLHLLGHDDHDAQDRAAMWAEQRRCLARAGIELDQG